MPFFHVPMNQGKNQTLFIFIVLPITHNAYYRSNEMSIICYTLHECVQPMNELDHFDMHIVTP